MKPYKAYDLNTTGLLPENWAQEIFKVAEEYAYHVHLDGKSSTSREPTDTSGADVYVVDGEVIRNQLFWLDHLYRTKFVQFANEDFDGGYCVSNSIENGLNINYLKGLNARYEWHVDSNPLTGVLFVTTHPEGSGGDLIFRTEAKEYHVYPKSGILILFDARAIPHTVMPLKAETYRISIPINFYYSENEQVRPADLDAYIYKKH